MEHKIGYQQLLNVRTKASSRLTKATYWLIQRQDIQWILIERLQALIIDLMI